MDKWNTLLLEAEKELSKVIDFPGFTLFLFLYSDKSVGISLAERIREDCTVRVLDYYLGKLSKIPKKEEFIPFLLKAVKRQKRKIELIMKIINEVGCERVFLLRDHILDKIDFMFSIPDQDVTEIPIDRIRKTVRFIKNFKKIFMSNIMKFRILEGKGLGEFIYRLYNKSPSLFGEIAEALSRRSYKDFESIISDIKKKGKVFPEEDITSLKKILSKGKYKRMERR